MTLATFLIFNSLLELHTEVLVLFYLQLFVSFLILSSLPVFSITMQVFWVLSYQKKDLSDFSLSHKIIKRHKNLNFLILSWNFIRSDQMSWNAINVCMTNPACKRWLDFVISPLQTIDISIVTFSTTKIKYLKLVLKYLFILWRCLYNEISHWKLKITQSFLSFITFHHLVFQLTKE